MGDNCHPAEQAEENIGEQKHAGADTLGRGKHLDELATAKHQRQAHLDDKDNVSRQAGRCFRLMRAVQVLFDSIIVEYAASVSDCAKVGKSDANRRICFSLVGTNCGLKYEVSSPMDEKHGDL